MSGSSYEPYTRYVDPADLVFDDRTIKRVEAFSDGSGWSVTCTDGVGCAVPNLDGATRAPEPGDRFRTYGSFGYPIQGQVINGVVLWYRFPEQRAEHRRRELASIQTARERRFEEQREQLDARYEALPEPFRLRIDRFRAADPRFRVESESYESFVLEQAALLADHLGDENKIRAWAGLPYEQQMAAAPKGWSDGHSNNTAGMAVRYAVALLRGEAV